MRYRKTLLFLITTLIYFTPTALSCAHDIEEGIRAVKTQDLEKAHEIFLTLAEEKCVDAMWSLAMMYYEGIGIEENRVKAFTWFKNAAVLGDPDSMNFIGFMYESGHGIEKNIDQAIACYEKAVEQGSIDAMNSLCILQMRMGNNIDAYMWYKLSEYYGYDCSEDENAAIQKTLRSVMRKEQLMAAQIKMKNWIQNHPDHDALIKKLNETGPSCYSSPLEAKNSAVPSLDTE